LIRAGNFPCVHKLFTFTLVKKMLKTFSNLVIYDIITDAIEEKVRKGLFLACPDKGRAQKRSPQHSFQFNFL
jgi:hypothetical protein